jgi:hypothetical protein
MVSILRFDFPRAFRILTKFTFSSAVPKFETELYNISVATTDSLVLGRNIYSLTEQSREMMETSFLPTLQRIESSVQQLRIESQPPPMTSSSWRVPTDTEKGPLVQYDRRQNLGLSLAASSTIRVQTSVYESKKCGPGLCGCQCHKVSRYQHHPYVAALLGSLFVGYSGVPLLSQRKCNLKSCLRQKGGFIKATYYFPTWLPGFSRMLAFMDKWNSLEGHEFSLKMPQVVPSSAEIFVLAQKGNVKGMQMLFSGGKASLHDVSAGEGRSALHVRKVHLDEIRLRS